jgi:imidazoleglycerol-phosphate dehydratase
MLESFAKHGLFDLTLSAKGDLQVDAHHTVEDVGIALGQAFRKALGGQDPPLRFFVLPMAESRVDVSLDVSNRAFLVYKVQVANDRVRDFDVSLVEDFLYAFSQNAGIDLHVELRYGKSPHHIVEAIFKGLARALRMAVELDPSISDVPSLKGVL